MPEVYCTHTSVHDGTLQGCGWWALGNLSGIVCGFLNGCTELLRMLQGWRACEDNVGVLIIRIGFGGPLYHNHNEDPPPQKKNSIIVIVIKAPILCTSGSGFLC